MIMWYLPIVTLCVVYCIGALLEARIEDVMLHDNNDCDGSGNGNGSTSHRRGNVDPSSDRVNDTIGTTGGGTGSGSATEGVLPILPLPVSSEVYTQVAEVSFWKPAVFSREIQSYEPAYEAAYEAGEVGAVRADDVNANTNGSAHPSTLWHIPATNSQAYMCFPN